MWISPKWCLQRLYCFWVWVHRFWRSLPTSRSSFQQLGSPVHQTRDKVTVSRKIGTANRLDAKHLKTMTRKERIVSFGLYSHLQPQGPNFSRSFCTHRMVFRCPAIYWDCISLGKQIDNNKPVVSKPQRPSERIDELENRRPSRRSPATNVIHFSLIFPSRFSIIYQKMHCFSNIRERGLSRFSNLWGLPWNNNFATFGWSFSILEFLARIHKSSVQCNSSFRSGHWILNRFPFSLQLLQLQL